MKCETCQGSIDPPLTYRDAAAPKDDPNVQPVPTKAEHDRSLRLSVRKFLIKHSKAFKVVSLAAWLVGQVVQVFLFTRFSPTLLSVLLDIGILGFCVYLSLVTQFEDWILHGPANPQTVQATSDYTAILRSRKYYNSTSDWMRLNVFLAVTTLTGLFAAGLATYVVFSILRGVRFLLQFLVAWVTRPEGDP